MALRAEQYIVPPEAFKLISPGVISTDIPLPSNCRGLLVETAGSINVTMTNGERRDGVPLLQGHNPGFFATVHAGGTASGIFSVGDDDTIIPILLGDWLGNFAATPPEYVISNASVTLAEFLTEGRTDDQITTNADGTNSVALGSKTNIVLWSQDLTNAVWAPVSTGTGVDPVITSNAAIAPDGTMTADRVDFNRGDGDAVGDRSDLIQSNITTVAGEEYIGAPQVKAATEADVGKQIAFRHVGLAGYLLVTLTADWQVVGDGDGRVETAVGVSSSYTFSSRGTITPDNEVSVLISDNDLKIGNTLTPYIPTEALTATSNPQPAIGVGAGLQSYDSSENQLPWSDIGNAAWLTLGGAVVTTGFQDSLGGNTAVRLQLDASAISAFPRRQGTASGVSTVANSVTGFRVKSYDGTPQKVTLTDVRNGANLFIVGDEWVTIEKAALAVTATPTPSIGLRNVSGVVDPTLVSDILVEFAQVENAEVLGPPVISNGTNGTRTQGDVQPVPGIGGLPFPGFNADAGTFILDLDFVYSPGTSGVWGPARGAFTIAGPTANDIFQIRGQSALGSMEIAVNNNGGGFVTGSDAAGLTAGQRVKMAVAYDASEMRFSINGHPVVTIATGMPAVSISPGVTLVGALSTAAGLAVLDGSHWNNNIRSVEWQPEELSDAELIALTM